MPGADPVLGAIDRAAVLQEMGRHDAALPLLQQALAEAPDNSWVLCHLAWAYYATGRVRKALALAHRAVALDPENEWPHRIRCYALSDLGKRRQAVNAGEEAVRLEPEGLGPLCALIEALRRAGKRKRALEIAGLCLKLHSNEATVYRIAADVHGDLGDWGTAEEHYRLSLAIDAEDFDALVGLAHALKMQGRQRDAIEVAEAAVRRAPPRTDARGLFQYFIDGYIPGISLKVFTAFMAVMSIKVVASSAADPEVRALGVFFLLFGVFTWSLVFLRSRRHRSELRPDLERLVIRELRAKRRNMTRHNFSLVSVIAWFMTGLILTIVAAVDLRQAFAGGGFTWFVVAPTAIAFVVLTFYWTRRLRWRLLWIILNTVWGILSFYLFAIILVAARDPALAARAEDKYIVVIIGVAWSVVGLLLLWHRRRMIALLE